MELHIYHHFVDTPADGVNKKLDRIISLIVTGQRKEDAMNQQLQDDFDAMLLAVNEETTIIASNTVLLDQLTALLEKAIAEGDVTEIRAKVAEVTDLIKANKKEISDNVVAHTPAEILA
jgi:hypothetical protein